MEVPTVYKAKYGQTYGTNVPLKQQIGSSYPLVNIQKTMERSTIFHGKIHDFYDHFQ